MQRVVKRFSKIQCQQIVSAAFFDKISSFTSVTYTPATHIFLSAANLLVWPMNVNKSDNLFLLDTPTLISSFKFS